MRFLLTCLLFPLCLHSQNRIGTGEAHKLYESYCLSCHGADLLGGIGGDLLDASAYKEVGKTRSFLDYVRKGNIDTGMPAFKEGLTDPQIRSLEIYIDELRQKTDRAENQVVKKTNDVYRAGGYDFKVETVVEGLVLPWSLAFMPDGSMLVTERGGSLRRVIDGQLLEPVAGIPAVHTQGQGGLLEVALHPDYADNGWVYLAFAHSYETGGKKPRSMTRVVRGRIVDNAWKDEELIYSAPKELYRTAGVHFGTRIVLREGYLFFAIGDRGVQNEAQDLSHPNGKIHRIHDDGRIPDDNPFLDTPNALSTIWAYGNRNPQGLDAHPLTGDIWESEHGPRGGDEINLIERGKNYGWPVITYGMNYNGKPITEKTSALGMEQPKHYWTPSIAVCGIDFYEGGVFPKWTHQLFAGGLASQELHRIVIKGGEVVETEIILKDEGRVRDVASGVDGHLYLVLNGVDRIVRLVPVR